MTLLETFGDAITTLRTDDPTSEANENEIEMAESLFNKLSERYQDHEEEKKPATSPASSSLSTIKQILKRAVVIALLVLLLLTPFVRTQIQKFSDQPFVYYIFVFVCVLIGSTIVQKAM
jgi:hypothetical protein